MRVPLFMEKKYSLFSQREWRAHVMFFFLYTDIRARDSQGKIVFIDLKYLETKLSL